MYHYIHHISLVEDDIYSCSRNRGLGDQDFFDWSKKFDFSLSLYGRLVERGIRSAEGQKLLVSPKLGDRLYSKRERSYKRAGRKHFVLRFASWLSCLRDVQWRAGG